MLKKSASVVLASFRGSTYRSVRLASSLAAALLDSLFEHPAGGGCPLLVPDVQAIKVPLDRSGFSAACLVQKREYAGHVGALRLCRDIGLPFLDSCAEARVL
jgi:hypothetical protein